MKFTRIQISVFLGMAALSWATVLLIQGVPITFAHLMPFGTVVGVLTIVAIVFERNLWSSPWLHGWFVQRPDLRGTWKVSLKSNWIDSVTNQPIPPITCYMGVEQTLSTLQMHLMTPESESWFVAHNIRPSPSENGYQIIAVYTNKPQVHLRSSISNMHLGAIVIDTHGDSKAQPTTLTAEYWTDRKTTGQMDFTQRTSNVFTRYEDAKRYFEQRSSKS